MSFDAVGTVISKARAAGMRVLFRDGAVAQVDPIQQVYQVARAGKKSCHLNSEEGRPYLAALCHDAEVVDAFHRKWGRHPRKMLGYSRASLPQSESHLPGADALPRVESIQVDLYV